MTRIRTLLLDIDGTVLDTREFIFAAFEHALGAHGLAVPGREAIGARVGEPLEAIYRRFGAAAAAALVETHRSFQERNLHLARPFPGAVETLAALRESGVRVAAVTSRSRRTSTHTLDACGIAGYFDAVVSAEDAAPLKPHPAPLRHALALLEAPAASAAMAGDTRHDIEAGKALGLFTVAATWGFGSDLAAAAPDALITNIRELSGALGLHARGPRR